MKKQWIFIAGMLSILTNIQIMHALSMPQLVPGRINVINKTRQDIDVYFYATQSDKAGKLSCKTYIKTIKPNSSTFVDPMHCLINVVEVRHTPEEQHEQTTKEYISKNAQNTETYLEYRGPNQLIEKNYKAGPH